MMNYQQHGKSGGMHMNVPILGQTPALKPQKWRCTTNPQHTFEGDPPAVGLPLNPMAQPNANSFYIAQKVCVFCLLESFQAAFPVEEVTDAE